MKKSIFLIYFFFFSIVASAQWAIGGVALGGFLVKGLIDMAAQSASLLVSQGESAGNAFILRAANQLNVAVQNAQFILHKEMDWTFDKLDTHQKTLLYELEKFRQTVENLKSTAFEFKDAVVVDVQTILGNVIPWAKQDLLIQRIDGTTQILRETDYKIGIMGIGFGTNTSKFESRITKVKVNGKDIVNFNENKIHSNQSQLIFTSQQLNEAIDPKKPYHAKLVVTNEVKRKKGFLFFKSWKTNRYDFDFITTIYPLYAGHVEVKYTVPKMDWETIHQNVVYTYQTPNHHQNGDIISYGWIDFRQLPNNQRYINPRYINRTGNGCPWTDYSQVVSEDDGKVLKIYGRSWGQPCDYVYGADVQEFKPVGEDVRTASFDLIFDKSLVLDLPAESKYWEITGKTITLHNFMIIGKSNFSDFLEFQDVIETGNTKKVIYKVNFSKDLQSF